MSDLRKRLERLEQILGVTRSSDPKDRPVGERVLLFLQGPGMTRADAVNDYAKRVRDPAMLGPGADVPQPESWYPEEPRRQFRSSFPRYPNRSARARDRAGDLARQRQGQDARWGGGMSPEPRTSPAWDELRRWVGASGRTSRRPPCSRST
jgi:hypothetical protein